MLTPEMIGLVKTLVIIAYPVVKLICYWLKLELDKRYGIN